MSDSHRRRNSTADAGSHDNLKEKKKAEYRLRMVEKIANYREMKIKKEFERIERELLE